MAIIINGRGRVGARVTSGGSSGGGTDVDAQAFITAASLTDATQISAVNTLVTGLKSNGLWSKMKAIYPVVGGNATAHSKNLINPSLYNLTFSSGWVHDTNGMTPNGSSSYANTSLNANSVLSLNSTHISYYGRTNAVANNSYVLIGAMDSNRLHLYPNSNTVSYNSINTSNVYSDVSINTQGLIIASRNSSGSASSYRNSTLIYNDSTTSTSKPNLNVYISALNNNGSAGYFSNIPTSFATIGEGLTSSEISNLYTLVQAYQTTLGRQV